MHDRWPAIRLLAACRVFLFPSQLKRLWSLHFMQPYFSHATHRDTFFFLTHHYYLSRYFSLAQRVDCAISHYTYEGQNYGLTYHRSVYRSPDGLVLWHRVVDDTRYTIKLGATEDIRHEGDLSVFLFVDDTRVCRMSFSYVNASLFGLAPGPTMFITRNQIDRNSALQRFRAAFKQNSPPYFCLAAVSGIAMANGMNPIFSVKDDAQIAYEKRFASSFRNSYSEFWKIFGAEESDRQSYRIPIPLQLSPLSDVKHKARAVARRHHWQEIILSTRRAMLEGRTADTSSAMEEEKVE
jgi:uncharacterized protein VirK/YbjX